MTLFREQPDLLRRFRRGERDALEAVYRAYVTDVLRLLRAGFVLSSGAVTRVPGIASEAALLDAVQDVFVKAFSESARFGYDGLRPYRPYLLRIASNLRIDQLRRQGRQAREVALDDLQPAALELEALLASDAPIATHLADPLDLDGKRRQSITAELVASLDAEQRRFVELRFEQELSQAEVAERMAVTRRRVRTLESDVLEALRRALRRQGLG